MSEERYQRIFSENLRYYMQLYGKTQINIINDLGFNKSAVSTWVNGTRLPRMDKVDILARYFGVRRSDLVDEHDQNSMPAAPSGYEAQLLESFRQLNSEGQQKAIAYVSDLVDLPKYKKVSDSKAMA